MVLLALVPQAASATVIDFEAFANSAHTFAASTPTTLNIATSPSVAISGGAVLTATLNLPADQTAVYGTLGGSQGGFTDPLTLTFSSPISNFFLDVFNGEVVPVSYTLADNNGHSQTFLLAPNLAGGTSQVGFAAAGNVITISAPLLQSTFPWDFFIDNIHFNEPLPGTAVPEPASLLLFGTGVLVACRRFRRKTVAGR
jgi:hypothetical protein